MDTGGAPHRPSDSHFGELGLWVHRPSPRSASHTSEHMENIYGADDIPLIPANHFGLQYSAEPPLASTENSSFRYGYTSDSLSPLNIRGLEFPISGHQDSTAGITNEMNNLPPTAQHGLKGIPNTPSEPSHDKTEWVPEMLRKGPICALVLLLAVFIALLEVFDILDREHDGFAASNSIVKLARYLPTVLVVLLAFVWEILLKDLKLVGPWALMRGNWASANAALLETDYIDALDIKALFISARNRQFAITLGYMGALICGALVPFANNLFFTDSLPRHVTTPQQLLRTSQIIVDDSLTGNTADNLSYFNPSGFLTYLGTGEMQFQLPDWTTKSSVYDSFNLSGAALNDASNDAGTNLTITATVGAFDVELDCDTLSWELANNKQANQSNFNDRIYLTPNKDDLEKANCHIFDSDYPYLSFPYSYQNVSSWINYTTCGQWQCPSDLNASAADEPIYIPQNCGEDESHDLRLTLNVWRPADSKVVSGLLCKISYTVQQHELVVDAKTASLLSVAPKANSTESIKIKNPESLMLKINQFLKVSDGASNAAARVQGQALFPRESFMDIATSDLQDENADYYDNSDFRYFPGSVRTGANSLQDITIDSIILMMTGGHQDTIAQYGSNMTQMAVDAAAFLKQLVSQIVHAEYRIQEETEIPGLLTVAMPVIRLRQASLRALQSLLAFLAFAALAGGTFLRPKTHLTSDPGTLGAIAFALARSAELEIAINGSGKTSQRALKDRLQDTYVRTSMQDDATTVHWRSNRAGLVQRQIEDVPQDPYRPLALKLGARVALVAVVAAMIAVLGVMWKENDSKGGFVATTREETYAWIFVPSTLLVLLGYAVNAVDSAVQGIQPYVRLQRETLSAKGGLDFNPVRHSIFSIGYRSLIETRSPLLLASSVTRIILSAVKILAAALFVTSLQPVTQTAQISIDSSIVTHLDSFDIPAEDFDNDQLNLLRTRAAVLMQFSPSESYNVSGPIGLMDGLVFSDISNHISDADTDELLSSGAQATLRIPAVQVRPICKTFGTEKYHKVEPGFDDEENPLIQVFCNANGGRNCPSATLDVAFNATSADGTLQWYWNMFEFWPSYDPIYTPESPWWSSDGVLNNVTVYMLAKANMANSSLPDFKLTSIASLWCNLNITPVTVSATITRPRRLELGSLATLPLAIKSYDSISITPIPSQPAYSIASLNWTSIGDDLWFRAIYPTHGQNLLFYIMGLENPDISVDDYLADPPLLGAKAGQVIAQYAAQMINLGRAYVTPQANGPMSTVATIATTQPRLVQSFETTVALQTLLGFVLICVLVVVVGIDTQSGLVKPPNSIAAQAGLLAGSELVRVARQAVWHTNRDDWQVWDGYLFSMGWWGRRKSVGVGGVTWRRYGIDIGKAEKM